MLHALAEAWAFYWPEVRGNVLAILPCAIVALVWYRFRKAARSDQKLNRILEHLDPESETDGLLDVIADRTDEKTPGGVGAILARLDQDKENT